MLAISGACSVVLLVSGAFYFRRMEKNIRGRGVKMKRRRNPGPGIGQTVSYRRSPDAGANMQDTSSTSSARRFARRPACCRGTLPAPRDWMKFCGRCGTSPSRCAVARPWASSGAMAPARARCSRSCRASPSQPGRCELHGRVGSLLEVGTGFHPELTGRENIYLSGAILGMSRTEIDAELRRDRRLRRDREDSSTPRSSTTRAACTCAWRSPSPLTSSPKS